MNSNYDDYNDSKLEKEKIDKYVRRMAKETKCVPDFEVSCNGKAYRGWFLTDRGRHDYAQGHNYQVGFFYTTYDRKEVLFLSVDGRLLVHKYYCVKHDDNRGKGIDQLEESVIPFEENDYLIFDFPRRRISNSIVEDNMHPNWDCPRYDTKGIGITLRIKKKLGPQKATIDKIINS